MNTRLLKGTLFSILLIISLLSISCGGGGGDTAPPPSPPDTTAPSMPGSLVADAISTRQIDLSWNVSTDNVGVTGYKIYRNGAYLTTVASNFRADTGLANNTNYCYTVSAVDAAGNESGQSSQTCTSTLLDSWTEQRGSAAADEVRGIVRDHLGNTYVTGATLGSIDGQGNAGDVDAFLTKYDSSGTWKWTRLIGTTGTDWGQAVDVDSAGNIYVTGSMSGIFAGSIHQGGKDVFLAKYDTNGNRTWYQQWGTSTDNFGYGVKVDGTAVYVTGPTYEDLPGESGNLIPNIFLSKRNTTDGSESLARILYGTENYSDYVEGIALDGSGNVYLTGYTTGAFEGTNNATYDVFLVKYNASLARQWTRQWGSTTHDYGHAVAVDSSDNILVTGYTSGSIAGQTNAGGDDIFLTKITNAGVVQWTKLFGTTAIDRAYGITIDNTNNVYLTGVTLGSLGGGTNLGQGDVFLMKCNSAGTQLWASLLGTSAVDIGIGVRFDNNDGYIYVTGNTSGDLDGNINAGGSDFFLLKY